MVDKTWDYDSNEPFSATENLTESSVTAVTRAIFVNAVSSSGATIRFWFRDNDSYIDVPVVAGEIYPYGIVKWSTGGTATSATIWGLW